MGSWSGGRGDGSGEDFVQPGDRRALPQAHLVRMNVVERSNLERIHGSVPEHDPKKTPKVVVARELVHQIDPSIEVVALQGHLPQPEVIDRFLKVPTPASQPMPSGAYRVLVFITPPSQDMESLINLGRFTSDPPLRSLGGGVQAVKNRAAAISSTVRAHTRNGGGSIGIVGIRLNNDMRSRAQYLIN